MSEHRVERPSPPRRPASGSRTLALAALLAGTLTSALAPVHADTAASSATESVPLSASCNRVLLTWPAGTPLDWVAAALSPVDSQATIWQLDAATRAFRQTYPMNDGAQPRTTVANETVVICLSAAGALTRPLADGPLDAETANAPFDAPDNALGVGEPVVAAPGASPLAPPARVPGYRERPSRFITLAPNQELPTPAQCAEWVRRTDWEPHPANWVYNNTTGGAVAQINGANPLGHDLYTARVDGDFAGTTDEILQWGACKWGIDEDIVRTIAFVESTWNQRGVGDNGQTYGIMQIKASVHLGTYPRSSESTAFAVDYMLAWWRVCYEGLLGNWIHEVEGNGRVYEAADGWGCIGMWYAGRWWSERAAWYIGHVSGWLDRRPWLDSRNF